MKKVILPLSLVTAIVAIAAGEPGHLIEERVAATPAAPRRATDDATLAR